MWILNYRDFRTPLRQHQNALFHCNGFTANHTTVTQIEDNTFCCDIGSATSLQCLRLTGAPVTCSFFSLHRTCNCTSLQQLIAGTTKWYGETQLHYDLWFKWWKWFESIIVCQFVGCSLQNFQLIRLVCRCGCISKCASVFFWGFFWGGYISAT